MFTAIKLILFPFRTWEKISLARRGAASVLFLYLLPWTAVAVAVEGYSLVHWGERHSGLEFMIKISASAAIRYALAQAILLIGCVIVGAKAVQSVAHSFHVPSDYSQCVNLMAYGFSPIFLARLLDAAPVVNTWACWVLGALISTSVLYQGVALVLRPEQTKGFGIYMVSVLLLVLSSLLSHFIAVTVLHGKSAL